MHTDTSISLVTFSTPPERICGEGSVVAERAMMFCRLIWSPRIRRLL